MTKCLSQYALLILITTCPTLFCSSVSAFERRPAPLFPPDKIFLLEEPRDWQDKEEILDRLRISPGDKIADIGAGSGYFTIPLASRVGDKGMVFAEEIQIEMVNYITKKVDNLGLNNVRVVFGKVEDPSLLDDFFNLVFLTNTYHELEKPLLMLENIRNDLKYNGKLAIIDWDPEKKSPFGPPLDLRVSKETVIKEVERIGFDLIERHRFMPYHYFLVFRKIP
ncbi:MAG: 2-methoxy-6-polyprenyl-1,4-benzoquinol methylase, mitochondrial [Candidatus Scalindua arabica]|uniref:2-methoxy-6-polyprenyl-1,4-benzoquinol methylase, mitochondrial n=1 Tax=Candidatus Scalindua arabica TaxID=1127984 RepID=A0A941ZYF8_9BACT|nr:2-methoxy-6-polyprenyl-1,4-benzoquinol methylase, mitochondrial [Candidatus Scalindua arabica]